MPPKTKRPKQSATVQLVYDPADGKARVCRSLQRELHPGDLVDVPAAEANAWRGTGFYRDPLKHEKGGG